MARKKIVVVDDDATVCGLICDVLSESGYEAKGFSHPLDAFGVLDMDEVDLLMLDFNMPAIPGDVLFGLFGIEAGAAGTIEPKRLPPMIIVTGYPDADRVAEWARTPGVTGVVGKPFDVDDLVSRVRRALGD